MDRDPGRIGSYFRQQWRVLLVVTVTGILYNLGLAAGPWFEGQMVQKLTDIIGGRAPAAQTIRLALTYLLVIAAVQFMRFLKRLYVRKFANRTSLAMKQTLYRNLLEADTGIGSGDAMTRAISDVDDCAEGMRKFTTELFDTGVVMAAYLALLLHYDVRLTLLCLIFPPLAWLLAQKLKRPVSSAASEAKQSAGRLADASLNRTALTRTWRIFGLESRRNALYENVLADYEHRQIRSGILTSSAEPVYFIISSVSLILIIWLGGRNVLGTGWTDWDIAAFSAFLACFTRLATKSSHVGKLFGAVQKARVSWERIRPFMKNIHLKEEKTAPAGPLLVESLSIDRLSGSGRMFEKVSFQAQPGQIIGITGPVSSGKTSLGLALLGCLPFTGTVSLAGRNMDQFRDAGLSWASWLGHDPLLLSASIEDNIMLGQQHTEAELARLLELVCLDREVSAMENGIRTRVGEGGVRLSGGQQARLALARALAHPRPLLILDDPFSAVDAATEDALMANLRQCCSGRVVLLISHRLGHFPETDAVLYLEPASSLSGDPADGSHFGTHQELLAYCAGYRRLWELAAEGTEVRS